MPLPLLSLALHLYLGWRLVPPWFERPLLAALVAVVLVATFVLLPLSLRSPRVRSPRLAAMAAWGGVVSLGLFSSLAVFTLLRDAALALVALADLALPGTLPLARWSDGSGRAIVAAAAAVTLWGFVNARRTAAVVTIDVPIRGLPAALHGFTIAQISDIHVGRTIRRAYLEAIVRTVNGLRVDMVAVTGDLVDGRVQDLAPHVAPLAGLASRHGTFFVTGNHEYYSGAAAWVHELRRLGLRVLLNEHEVLRHGDAVLVVAGVTDWSAHHFDPSQRSDPCAAIAGAPPQAAVRLLLAHQPRTAAAAVQAGFDLQLSGHTHGGQFWPWTHFVRLQQPFTAGLHRMAGLWVYVSRGTGYWGPPKRFGAPSEITRVRLVAA